MKCQFKKFCSTIQLSYVSTRRIGINMRFNGVVKRRKQSNEKDISLIESLKIHLQIEPSFRFLHRSTNLNNIGKIEQVNTYICMIINETKFVN
jgi:hypothetical protein